MNEERKVSKLIVGLILVVVGVGILFWAVTSKKATAPSQKDANTSSSTTNISNNENSNQSALNSNAATALITFTDSGFDPNTVSVKVGATVTVKNNSSKEVQFSSDDHPTHRKEPELNLSVLKPGESSMFIVSKVGTWGYHDHLNEDLTGTLVVTK